MFSEGEIILVGPDTECGPGDYVIVHHSNGYLYQQGSPMLWLLQKLRSSITLLIAITTGSITAIASFFGKAPWFFIVAVSTASILSVLAVGAGWQDYQLLQNKPESHENNKRAK